MLNNIYFITALKRDIFTPCKHPKKAGTDGIAVHCSEMKMKKNVHENIHVNLEMRESGQAHYGRNFTSLSKNDKSSFLILRK